MRLCTWRSKTNPIFRHMNKPYWISPDEVSQSWLSNTVYHFFFLLWRMIRGREGLKEGELINFLSLKRRGLIKMKTNIIWQEGLINRELTIILILSLPWQYATYEDNVMGYVGNFTRNQGILFLKSNFAHVLRYV